MLPPGRGARDARASRGARVVSCLPPPAASTRPRACAHVGRLRARESCARAGRRVHASRRMRGLPCHARRPTPTTEIASDLGKEKVWKKVLDSV